MCKELDAQGGSSALARRMKQLPSPSYDSGMTPNCCIKYMPFESKRTNLTARPPAGRWPHLYRQRHNR